MAPSKTVDPGVTRRSPSLNAPPPPAAEAAAPDSGRPLGLGFGHGRLPRSVRAGQPRAPARTPPLRRYLRELARFRGHGGAFRRFRGSLQARRCPLSDLAGPGAGGLLGPAASLPAPEIRVHLQDLCDRGGHQALEVTLL